jgi:hypothetical protein
MRNLRAISGYRVNNLAKFLRAREGATFGKAVGFLPISAQRCIAFESKSWRISGRAFIFLISSGGALRRFRQYSNFGADARNAVFPVKMGILACLAN